MTLESQLKRTTWTIYGEIMRDSGVTLPNGKYIPGKDLVLELVNHGLIPSTSAPEVLKDLNDSVGYGNNDNIWTGIQFQLGLFRYIVNPFIDGFAKSRLPSERAANYTFNPWKELMKGKLFGTFLGRVLLDNPSVFRSMHYNPQRGVERVRDMYASFANLPQALQNDFLGILESYPCNLNEHVDLKPEPPEMRMPSMDGYYPEVEQRLLRIREGIMRSVPEGSREDIFYVLNLLAFHTICVGKGELIRRQIEDLMAYDTRQIPSRWEKGHLDQSVIEKKRTELTNLLAEGKITHF